MKIMNNLQRDTMDYGPYSHQQFGTGVQMGKFGLRDKIDQGTGLVNRKTKDIQVTSLKNMIYVDTRDCIGEQSIKDAKTFFIAKGGRKYDFGNVVSSSDTTPNVLTLNSTEGLRNGDTITINGARGNTNINGVQVISSVDHLNNTVVISRGSNGTYQGGGTWKRESDRGYPQQTDLDSNISGNTMSITLHKELKNVRDISLFHVVIPRDIIPLYCWLPDFIQASIDAQNNTYTLYTSGTVTTDYTTRIPQEEWYIKERMVGFYSTPLDIWRTYEYGAFSMQNAITPPPLKLWNPPGPGSWPLQPIPYPYQTVPTYKSRDFSVIGREGFFHLILSGYGVYDLVDWTVISSPSSPIADMISTSIVRKLVLLLLTPVQSYNGVDYVDLILNCNTTSNSNPSQAYGFGDFQRYVPGPGHGLNYQPYSNTVYNSFNSSTTGPPNVASADSPIPFPHFRGNVWGPYSSPGDRFQKLGLRDVVQDLYLNGDLNNLLGNPIIVSNVPPQALMLDPSFGLNFSALIPVTLGNISHTTNPNILNAMRIVANGFGASTVRAEGANNPGPVGPYYTNQYQSAGGIGPSSMGSPSTWSSTGVNGAGNIDDPIAQGPGGSGPTPSNTTGTGANPDHIPSFYDLGPNNGLFRLNIQNYIGYTVNDIPDNNVIIRIEEALRDERAQSTRSTNGDALLDCPIRLNLGSSAGTQQYVEALQALLAQGTGYWEKRYFNPKASLSRLNIRFYTYEGTPIPLEKMLQQRAISNFLNTFIRVNEFLSLDFGVNPFSFNFLFDPTNPQLMGRVKRYISMIFKVTTYQGNHVGSDLLGYGGSIYNKNNEDEEEEEEEVRMFS